MNHGRANLIPSPYRDRSVEENLKLFELMRVGYFKEGEFIEVKFYYFDGKFLYVISTSQGEEKSF